MSSQESQRIAQTLSRVPQGTLAWDPEYAEYLRWLAADAGMCGQAPERDT